MIGKCSTRRDFLKLAGLTLGALIYDVKAVATNRPEWPNIVVILADDLGWGSLNCYGAPKNLIRTPNCDRLANEGHFALYEPRRKIPR